MRRRQCVQASPTPATTLQPAPKERGLPPPYSTRVPGQDERTGLATSSGRELAVDTGLQGARNNDSEGVHEYKPVVAVKVAGAVAVHPRDEARRGVPHGPIEVVARALAVKHTRGSVVEEAGGKRRDAKHGRPLLVKSGEHDRSRSP